MHADPFHVTFGAGVAQHGLDGADLQATYRAADEILYQAKAAGRDRVLPGCRSSSLSDTVDVAVVEDDPVTAQLLLRALTTQGYTARWISDGAAAARASPGCAAGWSCST